MIKGIIKYSLSFLIPFIAGLILFPRFFGLELTQNAIMFIALYAFTIFIFVIVYRKHGHQGQLPIWIGLTLMFGTAFAIYGSIGINNQPKWFELDAQSQGFALIGGAIGFVFFYYGMKAMSQFSYGLGNIKWGKK